MNRFTEAMNESLEYANSHPDEVLVLPKWPPDIKRDSVSAIAELAEKEGVLQNEPNIADLMP